MFRSSFWAVAGALLCAAAAGGGEYNPTLDIGAAAPAWKDLPGVDGRRHSLADLKEVPVVVLLFTCNSCPIATDYEDRIIALANKYGGPQGKVAFVAVNVNKVPEDSFENMQRRAREKQYPFPYLLDETQQIARDYGATFTPEFFVLDAARKVAYMGGLDDSSNPSTARRHYLADAIEAVLAGKKPPVAETVAIGCKVRYDRRRKP